MEQKSIEWYKARLGKITGSMVYTLMGTPRKKDEVFTDTAKGYLYQVAAERNLNEYYKGEHFDEWLQRTNIETFAMRYGTELEESARECYDAQLSPWLKVEECGFNQHPALKNYGDSPDGHVWEENTLVGCIEIKCPNPATWMKYRDLFRQGKTLKEVEEKYWWQCQSHLLCSGADWCDFVYYDKMQVDGLQVVRIMPDNDDMAKIEERVSMADNYIENLLKTEN